MWAGARVRGPESEFAFGGPPCQVPYGCESKPMVGAPPILEHIFGLDWEGRGGLTDLDFEKPMAISDIQPQDWFLYLGITGMVTHLVQPS